MFYRAKSMLVYPNLNVFQQISGLGSSSNRFRIVYAITYDILDELLYLFERRGDQHDVHCVAEIVRAKQSGVDKLPDDVTMIR